MPLPPSRIHVLGACGTAMATLSALLSDLGHEVRGSDEDAYPPMSDFLRERAIEVRTPYAPANLDPSPDLVVVGNAIARGNPELEEALDRGLRLRSMPEVLRDEILEGRHAVVVTGTHGKTTTAALAATALHGADRDPTVFVGGYLRDFAGPCRLGRGPEVVVEGDEYDSAYFDKAPKFLKYEPRTLVVNNVEFDHADIFSSIEEIELQFRRVVNLVPRSGLVLVGDGCPRARAVVARSHAPVEAFGLAAGSAWRAVDLEHRGEATSFTLLRADSPLGRVTIPHSGEHNVRNATAALAAAVSRGADFAKAAAALAASLGVRRRLELRGSARGVLVYDDFAHHPTAIRETLRATRARHPGRRVWGVFEPRSWTNRRNVHQEALAAALAEADAVILAPVFQPERVPAGRMLDVQAVVAAVEAAGRPAAALAGPAEIAAHVAAAAREGDVVLVMSNGGFGGVHDLLLERLRTPAVGPGPGVAIASRQ